MGAFKDKKSGSWYVQFSYTGWQGKRQQKLKRGFATKHEALEWEREFLLQKQTDVIMSFGSFYELYKKDIKPRLKENTWQTKENIIEGIPRDHLPDWQQGRYVSDRRARRTCEDSPRRILSGLPRA